MHGVTLNQDSRCYRNVVREARRSRSLVRLPLTFCSRNRKEMSQEMALSMVSLHRDP